MQDFRVFLQMLRFVFPWSCSMLACKFRNMVHLLEKSSKLVSVSVKSFRLVWEIIFNFSTRYGASSKNRDRNRNSLNKHFTSKTYTLIMINYLVHSFRVCLVMQFFLSSKKYIIYNKKKNIITLKNFEFLFTYSLA